MQNLILRVALPVPLNQLFDYILPNHLITDGFATLSENNTGSNTAQQKQHKQHWIGRRVSVPFGKTRQLVGVVVDILTPEQTDQTHTLKAVDAVIDESPILSQHTQQLVDWASRYYHFAIGEVYAAALPTLLRQGRELNTLEHFWVAVDGADTSSIKRAPRLQQAYQLVAMHDSRGALETALLQMGATKKQLQQLAERGLATSYSKKTAVSTEPYQLAALPLQANSEQQQAIKRIQNSQGFNAFLLDGVTGSGKTEVYLQAMQPILADGGQVLVLVPEIGLTPQTIARFKSRFHVPVVSFHSGLSDIQRLAAWRSAANGEAKIIIGTRSSVFTELPHLRLIIVDEEHDLSFKQQDGFRYNAKDVALKRAHLQQCPIVLGSATPSLESLYLVQKGKLQHLKLLQRANAKQSPIELVDCRGIKKQEGISSPVLQAIKSTLKKGQQVLVFINRRGFAPVLLCEQCGYQANCPQCDAHLTLHYNPTLLRCHHCGFSQPVPNNCPACHTANLKPTGVGTARVEQFLKQQFADTPVLRIDRDSTAKAKHWDSVYEHIALDQPAILVGTQMIAKGHHFPRVTLVCVLDMDGGFFSADFRALERTAQLMLQVAGRAGRGDLPGHVMVQTLQPENHYYQQLKNEGYNALAQTLLKEREMMQLPPYRYAVLIRAESTDKERSQQVLMQIMQQMQQLEALPIAQPDDLKAPVVGNNTQPISFWGPVPAPMEKKANWFRSLLLLLSFDRKKLHQLLGYYWTNLSKQAQFKGMRITLDIDPQEMS